MAELHIAQPVACRGGETRPPMMADLCAATQTLRCSANYCRVRCERCNCYNRYNLCDCVTAVSVNTAVIAVIAVTAMTAMSALPSGVFSDRRPDGGQIVSDADAVLGWLSRQRDGSPAPAIVDDTVTAVTARVAVIRGTVERLCRLAR